MAENQTNSGYLVVLPKGEENSLHSDDSSGYEVLPPNIVANIFPDASAGYTQINEADHIGDDYERYVPVVERNALVDESQSNVQPPSTSMSLNEAQRYEDDNEASLYAQVNERQSTYTDMNKPSGRYENTTQDPSQTHEKSPVPVKLGGHDSCYEETSKVNDYTPVEVNIPYHAIPVGATSGVHAEDITQFNNVAYNAVTSGAIDIELYEEVQQQQPATESTPVVSERTRQYKGLCKFWPGRFEVITRLSILLVRHACMVVYYYNSVMHA